MPPIVLLAGVAALAMLAGRRGGGARVGRIIDVTDQSANVRYNRGSVAGILKRKRKRDMADVTGITLHQVGVANVGDAAVPKMTYHLVVHKGDVYLIHPFNTYLYHGHRFNRQTVGISVSGLYGPNTPLSAEDADALRRAITYARNEIRNQGGRPKYILAHRQSSADRGGDPGPAIWQEGALWAERNLGMQTLPDHAVDTGNPIPDSWMRPGGVAGIAAANDPTYIVQPELDDAAVG